MRGRTALYHRRHLLQLVAIKRLQAQGLSLVDVQQQLLAASDRDLARLAKLSNDHSDEAAASNPAARAFWSAEPSAVAGPAAPTPQLPLQGVPLAELVTLLLAPARPIEPHDLEAIRAAAA